MAEEKFVNTETLIHHKSEILSDVDETALVADLKDANNARFDYEVVDVHIKYQLDNGQEIEIRVKKPVSSSKAMW